MLLYPLAFIFSILTLSIWFFFQKRNKSIPIIPVLFYISFGAWAASWFLADGSYAVKLPILIRDLIMMGGMPIVMQLFSKNKLAFILALGLLLGIYYGFGWDIWEQSFNKKDTEQVTEAQDTDFELLLELKEGAAIKDLQHITQKYNLSFEKAFQVNKKDITDLDDYYVVNIPNHLTNDAEIAQLLLENNSVDWVENNETIQLDKPIAALKKTPVLNKKFGVSDPNLSQQWAMQTLEIDKLYKLLRSQKVQPKTKARIFILDTGIDAQHEDLNASYNSLNTKYDTDQQGHGTHCAGIAAAVTNNGKGIASFALNTNFVEVSSIKVLNNFGSGTQQGIINGIIEAADAGADVISMSLGGLSTDSKQRAYKLATEYAAKSNAIIIVAAGNSNKNAKSYAPANSKGVICVSAIDEGLNKASFSNTVQNIEMGISAPGTNIYSTFPNNDYKSMNGTSMATPFVAGLVGLLKSLKPTLSTKEAYEILKKSGSKTNNNRETGKLINPTEAVKQIL